MLFVSFFVVRIRRSRRLQKEMGSDGREGQQLKEKKYLMQQVIYLRVSRSTRQWKI